MEKETCFPAHETLLAAVPESNPPERVCRNKPQQTFVEKLNEDARGIARHEGKVTFIEGALPGETVTFCLAKQRGNYDTGWTLHVDEPSADRVEPACPHFGVCGGCSLQHMAAPAQIHAKEDILREKFQQFGRLAPEEWLPPLKGPEWHYRRSARIGARFLDKKDSILVGFRERASKFLTPLKSCAVLDKRVSDLMPELHYLINQLSCRRRLPQIEISCSDDVACMVFRHLVPLTDKDIEILTQFGRTYDVHVCTQAGGPDTIQAVWPAEMPELRYTLPDFDLEMHYGPAHFVQVNAEINEAMIGRAIGLLAPGPDDVAADLFCGLGNFTLPLARRSGHVTGVENHEGLLDLARKNAPWNKVDNAEFRCVDLHNETAAQKFWKESECRLLLLDPPRTGAMETIRHLPKKQIERIVYVSCQPATLARDCEYLVNALGYTLKAAGVMDMFPHTSHVESMALLEL